MTKENEEEGLYYSKSKCKNVCQYFAVLQCV